MVEPPQQQPDESSTSHTEKDLGMRGNYLHIKLSFTPLVCITTALVDIDVTEQPTHALYLLLIPMHSHAFY